MNPWKKGLIYQLRGIARFVLWLVLAVNAAIVLGFVTRFNYEFCRHAWSWCQRELFPGNW